MRVRDFGRFDGPLVLFGGPYSNLPALQALFEIAGGRESICTGDIVAYGASPCECVKLMQKLDIPTIAGNCERQVADGADDCGCGFGDGSTCELLSRGWYPFVLRATSRNMVEWMSELPDIGVFTQRDRRYAVIHGGATAINMFIWPNSPVETFLHEIAALETHLGKIDGVVAGHSGIAFQRQIGHCQWINAGAIGLPPNDGRPETRYAILENYEVEIERLSYDYGRASLQMREAGLTQGYEQTLETGLWPSEDVLPPGLRRGTNRDALI